jgi:hypothetical protein
MQAIQQSRDSEAERAAVVKKPGSAAKGGHGGKLHSTAEVSDDDSYSDDDDAAPQPPHPMLGDVGKSSSKMAIEAYLAAREAAYQVFFFFLFVCLLRLFGCGSATLPLPPTLII